MRRILAALGAVALVLAACGADDDGTEPGARPAPGPSQTTGADPAPTSTSGGGGGDTGGGAERGDLSAARVTLTEVASLESPTALAARPGSEILYVAEREGRVRELTVAADGTGRVADEPLLDISDQVSVSGERGLLGLTFSTDGDRLYVSYTNPAGDSRLVEYAMDGERADPSSRRELLGVDQPFANHNGGAVHVGPDGFLYFGLGDGGAGDDPGNRAQNPDVLLGKMLRIDPTAPSGDRPYGIPEGNPYADGGGRPEIFLSGVRNPWRFSFDRETGDLWIADVGQNTTEEIDLLPRDGGGGAGTNLGWSGYEGSARYIDERVPENATPPVFEMSHEDGWCSVTGGVVYRGSRIPALRGAYLFGDYCRPAVSAIQAVDGVVRDERELGVEVSSLVSIDADDAGEVYLLSLDGPVYRLDPG